MTQPQVEQYDFGRPSQLAGHAEQLMQKWHHGFVKLSKARMLDSYNLTIDLEAGDLNAFDVEAVVPRFESPMLIMQHCFGSDEIGWLAMPRPLILALLGQMLGQDDAGIPEDRGLTDLEDALFDLLCDMFNETLTESQPCKDKLPLIRDGRPRPDKFTQVFPEAEQVAVADMNFAGNLSGQTICWILSQNAVNRFVTHVEESEETGHHEANHNLEELVKDVPVTVSVRLGKTTLHWNDLAGLKKGDVILLDQRVTDPLVARIANKEILLGWAGRQGTRQAFRVSEILDDE